MFIYTSAMTFTFYLNEISIDSLLPEKINQLETPSKIDTTPMNASLVMSPTSQLQV